MSTKAKWRAGTLEFFSSSTGSETIRPMAPVYFNDDFVGYKFNEYVANENTTAPWLSISTQGTRDDVTLLANTANGILELKGSADAEAQLAVAYFGDQLCFKMAGAIFEARMTWSVLPTVARTAYLGLASAHDATADDIVTNAWFFWNASGAVLIESDDGTTDTDDQATSPATTSVAATYNIYRIDATDITAVKFYIDDTLVGTTSMAALTTATVQPYIRHGKGADASLGNMYVDYIKIWTPRA